MTDVVKPFSQEELRVRLGNLLVMHRTRRLLQQELASSQQNVETLARALQNRASPVSWMTPCP